MIHIDMKLKFKNVIKIKWTNPFIHKNLRFLLVQNLQSYTGTEVNNSSARAIRISIMDTLPNKSSRPDHQALVLRRILRWKGDLTTQPLDTPDFIPNMSTMPFMSSNLFLTKIWDFISLAIVDMSHKSKQRMFMDLDIPN